jgi:hypothetical protein
MNSPSTQNRSGSLIRIPIEGERIPVRENTAATKIQKVMRGNKTRKTLNENRQDAQAAANDLTDQILGDSINEASGLFHDPIIHDPENTAATNIQKVMRGNKSRAKTARLKIFKNLTKDKNISSNISNKHAKRYYSDIDQNEPAFKKQLVKDTTNEDTIRDIVNGMIKKVEKSHGLQKIKAPKVKKGNPVLKRQYDVNFIPQNTVKQMYEELKQPMNYNMKNMKVDNIASTKIGSVFKGHLARKKLNNEITNMENQLGHIENKVVLGAEQHVKMLENQLGNIRQQKIKIIKDKTATKIQSAIRNKIEKNDMMNQRQQVREAELKQMEAVKDKEIKDNAAKKTTSVNKKS